MRKNAKGADWAYQRKPREVLHAHDLLVHILNKRKYLPSLKIEQPEQRQAVVKQISTLYVSGYCQQVLRAVVISNSIIECTA